jgi:hypothetical protein
LRKVEKYKNLNLHLNPQFSNFEVKIVTVEVSVLGFISDLTPLLKLLKLKKLPVSLLNNISLIAINHSKDIYFNRDNSSSSPLG